MTARDAILGRIRTSLGRKPGELPRGLPPVLFSDRKEQHPDLIQQFCRNLERLGVKSFHAQSLAEAREYAASLLAEKTSVVSNALFLKEVGIDSLPGVQSGVSDKSDLRDLCATVNVGVTSADYALADTGSLVMLSSNAEARMISLLPPVHLAIVSSQRIVPGLDDLLTYLPLPADLTSAMVFVTGTSRTGDIEQILVRGVHGPGEVHVVVV